MGMRESIKSLTLYFGLSGGFAILSGVQGLRRKEAVAGLIALAFGAAYAYISIRLPKLLKGSLLTVKWILIAASAMLGISLLAGIISRDAGPAIVGVLGLLINWYLFRNVKRLAAEAKAQAPSTPTPRSTP